jgi:uncharacterized protein (TIGR02145 family)
VWARYAWEHTNCTSASSCATNNVWLHFQWWSSTWYLLTTNATSFLQSYSYPLDSWLPSTATTSDTWSQWPCPSWYHIPSPQEWIDIVEIWNFASHWALPNAKPNTETYNWQHRQRNAQSEGPIEMSKFRTILKLPAAGWRYSASGLSSLGSDGNYWSSLAHSKEESRARRLNFAAMNVLPGSRNPRRAAFSIRCFKN